jgi:hypothetical protein
MTRTFRLSAALAMIAMVAVISAGCGGTGSSSGTSTAAPVGNTSAAGNTGTTSSTGTTSKAGTTGKIDNKNATPRDKAVKFAECMRENGVPHFPDPKASGAFPDFGIDVSGPVWNNAVGACKALQPPGSLSAKMSSEQMSAALKFAQCVRENGVKDFPDPVQGEPLVDTYKIPSSNTPAGMSILNAATHKCSAFVAAASAGQ